MDINKSKYDIFSLSETRLSSDIEMLQHVPSLDLFTNHRSTLGSSVLLYVRDALTANKLVIFSVVLEQIEALFVSFSVGETNFVIGNVYRPPNSNNDDFMSKLSNVLNNALTEFPNSIFYIMGDFNYDVFLINSNNRCMESYLLFTSLGFFPTITRPTRVSSYSKFLIDNVGINNIGAVKNSGVILSGISDHFPIFFNQYLKKKTLDTHVNYKVRIRDRACYDSFRSLLSEVNWDGICNQINAKVMFDSFNTTLFSIYNGSFPYVIRKTKPLDTLKPYFNADLRELIEDKDRLEKNSNAILLITEINIGFYVTD